MVILEFSGTSYIFADSFNQNCVLRIFFSKLGLLLIINCHQKKRTVMHD